MEGIVKGEVYRPSLAARVLTWVAVPVGLLLAFMVYGWYLGETPEGQERAKQREEISRVCALQDDTLQELSVRRDYRAQCRYMQYQFRERWGTDP